MKLTTVCLMVLFFLITGPVLAQRLVTPSELRTHPLDYRNSTIKITDIYTPPRAGVTEPLAKAGYTLNKYVAFGLKETRIPCFVRRGTGPSGLVSELKPGTRVTVTGTVRQPVAKVKRRVGRGTERIRLERVVIEVSKIEQGWPEIK